MPENIFSIAICDDEQVFAGLLGKELRRSLSMRGASSGETLFYDAQRLLEAVQEGMRFDLYLLDIDMPGIDGMKAAQTIRRKDPQADIVFVSTLEEMVYESFRVKPLYFVRKSHIQEDLQEAVDLFLLESRGRQQESAGCVVQDEAGKPYRISFAETLYLEASDKYVKVWTDKESFLIRSTISQLEKSLSGMGFVRTHRSFLVNLRKIYAIHSDSVTLDDGRDIPLSRNRAQEVRTRFCLEA